MTTKLWQRLKLNPSRYWEVDSLRGVAILLMVYYHFMWDLTFFGVVQLDMVRGPWQWFARFIATMFLTMMGVSLVISYDRARRRLTGSQLFLLYLQRGGQIFGLAMIITVATYFFVGKNGFVIFGILHLIGFSVVAAYPFLAARLRWFSLGAGILVIGVGLYLEGQVSTEPWLIWLGVKQVGRSMVDYYPVLPYFGLVLIGLFLGWTLYPGGEPRLQLPDWSAKPLIKGLTFLGQHSLFIYLIHQPILIGLLIVWGIGSF